VNGSKDWTENDTVKFCSNSCYESYGISFINTTQFEKIYRKVCVQSGTVQGTTTATDQKSTNTSELEQRTSSGDGNASEQFEKCDVPKSGQIMSAVVSIIAIIIIITITVIIVVFFKCSNNNNQEQNNERLDEVTSSVGEVFSSYGDD
ncbi:uncharacterized protein LOC125138900 isoform X1, partial [Tachysurus ichikawai]